MFPLTYVDAEYCGPVDNVFTSSEMQINITTPNYPGNYPNMLDCKWYLTADESLNGAFLISFLDFSTEVYKDNLTIG